MDKMLQETVVRAARLANVSYDITRSFISKVAIPILDASPEGLSYVGISNIYDGDFAFKVELSHEYCTSYYYFNPDGTVDYDCPEGLDGRERIEGETWEQRVAKICGQ